MRKRSERSLVLLSVMFVFACLLIAGGSRLVGHEEQEAPLSAAAGTLVRAALCSAPSEQQETCGTVRQEQGNRRHEVPSVVDNPPPQALALCDANGNVLREQTYLHAVYQAFALGDGFA